MQLLFWLLSSFDSLLWIPQEAKTLSSGVFWESLWSRNHTKYPAGSCQCKRDRNWTELWHQKWFLRCLGSLLQMWDSHSFLETKTASRKSQKGDSLIDPTFGAKAKASLGIPEFVQLGGILFWGDISGSRSFLNCHWAAFSLIIFYIFMAVKIFKHSNFCCSWKKIWKN